MIKAAIFDMDGTLIDSMPYWNNLSIEFLQSKGITEIDENIWDIVESMTMRDVAEYFKKRYGIPMTYEEMKTEMNAIMQRHYEEDVPLKKKVIPLLKKMHDEKIKMAVASATDERLMRICLARLGVLDYFDEILSCETLHTTKKQPLIYQKAAELLGATTEETAVYEDALYAATTAKNAGFYVVGIKDYQSEAEMEGLIKTVDEMLSLD